MSSTSKKSEEIVGKMDSTLTTREQETLETLKTGGSTAQALFFETHRRELKQMTGFRINHQLKRRIDESDIMQQAYIEYCERIEKYLEDPRLPPAIWLRRLVRQVIARQNRDHFGTQCRDLRREQYDLSSVGINVEQLCTSLSSIGARLTQIELRDKLMRIVNSMSPIEREILVLVHFEELTMRDAAIELGINLEAAKKRYRRALNRLRELHAPEFNEFCGSV